MVWYGMVWMINGMVMAWTVKKCRVDVLQWANGGDAQMQHPASVR